MIKKLLSNPYILTVFALISAFVIYKSWAKISLFINKIRVSSQLNARGASGAVVEINLQEIADEIYISFHENWFGAFEDEERAIKAIQKATNRNSKAVAVLYAKRGVNMYDDFLKYLSESQYLTVKNILL